MLDIGCGDNKKVDLGLDARRTRSVDIVADARMLPSKNESIDHVYSSNTIEHFSHLEVGIVVVEWVRILKKGGVIEILCPDLRARAFLFFLSSSWQNVRNIYGGQDYTGNYQRCGFSFFAS